MKIAIHLARGSADIRGPLDRGPRVDEIRGPRSAGGHIYIAIYRHIYKYIDINTNIYTHI